MKSAGFVLSGGVGLWCLLFFPARLLGGDGATLQTLAALGLTLVPALATLLWAAWAFRNSPEMQLLAVLGGSFFRMAIALGGAWFLLRAFPEAFDESLWVYLIVFYLAILSLEVGALVYQASKKEQAQGN